MAFAIQHFSYRAILMVMVAMRYSLPEAVPREGVISLAKVFRGGAGLLI
jgi:hypothetical protein